MSPIARAHLTDSIASDYDLTGSRFVNAGDQV
jgi:hypothetical protein